MSCDFLFRNNRKNKSFDQMIMYSLTHESNYSLKKDDIELRKKKQLEWIDKQWLQ